MFTQADILGFFHNETKKEILTFVTNLMSIVSFFIALTILVLTICVNHPMSSS